MGQYYMVVNIDKKQRLEPWSFDNGAKLMEWSYNGNMLVRAMINLLSTDWKGDRVYVVGDYADTEDMGEIWAKTYKAVIDELGIDEKKHSLFAYADEYFENVSHMADVTDRNWEAIVNRQTGQYIDLHTCPIEWTWYSKEDDTADVASICPLPLLLAMGNGRGGGDYRPQNTHIREETEDLVGSWCESSASIEVFDWVDDPDDYEREGLKEFRPDFTEQQKLISYDKEAEEREKCLKAGREMYAKLESGKVS